MAFISLPGVLNCCGMAWVGDGDNAGGQKKWHDGRDLQEQVLAERAAGLTPKPVQHEVKTWFR